MTPVRIFFLNNEILIDSIPQPFVAGSLFATMNGNNVEIRRVESDYLFIAVDWSEIAQRDGTTFTSSQDAMTYLNSQLSMRRRLGDSYPFTNLNVVTIQHNLGFFPNATVIDSAGDPGIGDVSYPDANTISVSFSVPISGTLYLS